MDGARFANAVATLGCAPADISWRAGVDVLCFGGVKNGLAVGEAVLFFDRALAHEFEWRVKQAGHLNSKMRLVTAPWLALLEGDVWLAQRASRQRHGAAAGAAHRRPAGRAADVSGRGQRACSPTSRPAVQEAAARQGLALLHLPRRHRLPPDVRLGHDARDRRPLRRRPARRAAEG